MLKFIEIVDAENEARLININCISDIFQNVIYLISTGEEQIRINTNHSYEEILDKLQDAGAGIYR